MEQSPENLIKNVIVNGKQLNLAEKDKDFGINRNYCSEFVSSINCILRGEGWNQNYNRNAIITGTNVITHETCKIFF